MQKKRRVRFDPELGVEAYCLGGTVETFPLHFHDYYVAGMIESGRRRMLGSGSCVLERGDMILFNPGEAHGCEQVDGPFSYRALNIGAQTMQEAARQITGSGLPPRLGPRVTRRSPLARQLCAVQELILRGEQGLRKEEAFWLFLGRLLNAHAQPAGPRAAESRGVAAAAAYLKAHAQQPVTLDMLAGAAGMEKYRLLRAFARERGISPSRYLAALRVARAQTLLQRGMPPAEAALEAGFADQSHLCNAFRQRTGLTPGEYRKAFGEEEQNG